MIVPALSETNQSQNKSSGSTRNLKSDSKISLTWIDFILRLAFGCGFATSRDILILFCSETERPRCVWRLDYSTNKYQCRQPTTAPHFLLRKVYLVYSKTTKVIATRHTAHRGKITLHSLVIIARPLLAGTAYCCCTVHHFWQALLTAASCTVHRT